MSDAYTRITVEVNYGDKVIRDIHEIDAWDLDIDDMRMAFESILYMMGYHPTNVQEAMEEMKENFEGNAEDDS